MKQIIIYCSLITFIVIKSYAQTGIFYFGDTSKTLINSRIIAMKESSAGELYLLGKTSDENYSNLHPGWYVADKTGKVLVQKTLEVSNPLYELNNLVVDKDGKIMIWGTETSNDRQTPYVKAINRKGENKMNDYIMTNTTTLTGDVQQCDTNNAVFAKTVKSSTNGKYHISIYKYSLTDSQQEWYKTLQVEKNEMASKLLVLKDNSIVLLGRLYDDNLTSYTSLIYKISDKGEIIWRRELTIYTSFFQQGISEGKNGKLIYVCSNNEERIAKGETQVITLNTNGEIENKTELKDIRSNGIITLKNGNIFLYGSHYHTEGNNIIIKAKYFIFDNDLKKVKEDEMGMIDAPDALLPGLAMTVFPTSSDFIAAIQLTDGRIACGGRVYMPLETSPDKIITSARANKSLLVLMDKDGNFRSH